MPSLETYRVLDRPITEQLRRSPLFASLPNDRHECLSLILGGALFRLPAGVVVFTQGDPAVLVVVTEGALLDDASGITWRAGSHFGAREALSGTPFAGAVRTVAPATVYQLALDRLRMLISLCPAIAKTLCAELEPAASAILAAAPGPGEPLST
jgi:CRP-like cAMP-binding protein